MRVINSYTVLGYFHCNLSLGVNLHIWYFSIPARREYNFTSPVTRIQFWNLVLAIPPEFQHCNGWSGANSNAFFKGIAFNFFFNLSCKIQKYWLFSSKNIINLPSAKKHDEKKKNNNNKKWVSRTSKLWQIWVQLIAVRKQNVSLGPPQTRDLVVDNYLWSTTKSYRQLSSFLFRQGKLLSCRQLSSFPFRKGKLLSCRKLIIWSLVLDNLRHRLRFLVVDNFKLSITKKCRQLNP